MNVYALSVHEKEKKKTKNTNTTKYKNISAPKSSARLLKFVTPSGKNSHSMIWIHHCLARFISARILRRYLKVMIFFSSS